MDKSDEEKNGYLLKIVLRNRPLSRGGHLESKENKKLCFFPSSLVLDERLDGQIILYQHCVIKFYLLTHCTLSTKVYNRCLIGYDSSVRVVD